MFSEYHDEVGPTTKKNKTGVINDPLGQPTVPASSDFRLKFWDRRTDNLCENSDHYLPGLWAGRVDQRTFRPFRN